MKKLSRSIIRVFWEAPTLIIFSVMLALFCNFLRSDGLSIPGGTFAQQQLALSDNELVIPIKKAKLLFENKAALFVDARPGAEYAEGHIARSLNIPFDDFDKVYMEFAEILSESEYIITYCDGEYCELSHDLALSLQEMGHTGVHYLINGWTEWQNTGLPTEIGGE